MRAVGRRKRIVAIDIPQRGQTAGKIGIVGFFAGIKPDVFHQQHVRVPA